MKIIVCILTLFIDSKKFEEDNKEDDENFKIQSIMSKNKSYNSSQKRRTDERGSDAESNFTIS